MKSTGFPRRFNPKNHSHCPTFRRWTLALVEALTWVSTGQSADATTDSGVSAYLLVGAVGMVLRIEAPGKTSRLHLLAYRNSYARETLGSHGIPGRKCR